MSFTQVFPGLFVQLQPPVAQLQPPMLQLQPSVLQLQPPGLPAPAVTVKTEPPITVKNEPPEIVEMGVNDILNSWEDENIPEIKKEDIVSNLKSESAPKNVFETEHSECGETQVFVKTENIPFVKVESITESENLNETEDVTAQGIAEVQDSNEYLNGINIRHRKPENSEKADYAESYTTFETKKVKVIEAPAIPVTPHEYITLAKDKHICNHCQHATSRLAILKYHIQKMHRDVTTMYQCPYCPFKSKWKWSARSHIIQKHKDTSTDKDIQWFKCNSCDKKFRSKSHLAQHTLVHLTHEQLQDKMKYCPVCAKGFKTVAATRTHVRFVHNKEAAKRMKCHKCDYTATESKLVKNHIEARHMGSKQRQIYECSQCDYKTIYKYRFENHTKSHEKKYCCEKCAFVTGQIGKLKLHELSHKKITEIDDRDLKYLCDQCDYKTYRQYSLDVHKLNHLKPEQHKYWMYLYCYHCPYRSLRKDKLKTHIFRHFKNKEVKFYCYCCKFVTLNRELLTEHIKNHSKVQSKAEINEPNQPVYVLYTGLDGLIQTGPGIFFPLSPPSGTRIENIF